MGENFLKQQAKAYRIREDAYHREFIQPTLLSASSRSEYKAAYNCRPLSKAPDVGTKVWINTVDGKLLVYNGTSLVGHVDDQSAAPLSHIITSELKGMAKAVVDGVSPLGDFTITCESEGTDAERR